MFNKKITLFLFGLMLFIPSANAIDLIADYTVTQTVPLDNYIAISGTFVDDLNADSGVQCDFYFSQGNTEIYRLTSENTDERGHFFSRARLTSTVFNIDEDYNVTTVCGTGTATSQITIAQRETPYQDIASWWLWLTNPETIFLPILITVLAFLIILVIYFIYSGLKQGRVRF